MPRKKRHEGSTDEAHDASETGGACGTAGGCGGNCQPRAVPVEDVVVGVVRLIKDGMGSVGGLGAVVAPGLKRGAADLTAAASQGLKRLTDLAGSLTVKKPTVAVSDETLSA
jgi:hypothetical protein